MCSYPARLRRDGTVGGHAGCPGAGQQPVTMHEASQRAAQAFRDLVRSPEYEAAETQDDWLK